MRTRLLPVLVGLIALLLTGCSAGTPSTQSVANSTAKAGVAAGVQRYVALGDSYTAAPYVYLTDVAGGCLRSDHNYPHLLAASLKIPDLADVSCGGATTKDMAAPQKTFGASTVPAQLDALSAGTELVTLGIGGNDQGLFGSLITSCPVTGPNGKPLPGDRRQPAGRCGAGDPRTLGAKIAIVQKNVTGVLRAIRTKAPQATVVLVGYPRIVQTGRACPTLLPVSAPNVPGLDAVTRDLGRALGRAAAATRTTYVDMYTASKGHDVCAGKQAWVNGVHTDPDRAAALHPFEAEQRAVASLVAAAVPAG